MAFNFTKKLTLSCLVTIAAVAAASNFMQPSFALTNGGSITAFGVQLTENFDSLATTGTAIAWVDNSTIPGVYLDAADLQHGDGFLERRRAV